MVTRLNTHNMAHTILVRLDVDDEYADIHPDITATDYLEGSKTYGWEVITERVFTESEVRAKDQDLKWALGWIKNEARHLRERGEPQEALEAAIDMIIKRHGIVLDLA